MEYVIIIPFIEKKTAKKIYKQLNWEGKVIEMTVKDFNKLKDLNKESTHKDN